jgi:two-component system LytT family response regulator
MQALQAIARPYLTHFPVREGDRFLLLRMEQIRWIEARANYVRVHGDGGAYIQRDTLRRLELLLDPDRFLRISRYAIVNLDRVRTIERTSNGNLRLELDGGHRLSTTRAYRAALKRLLRRGHETH